MITITIDWEIPGFGTTDESIIDLYPTNLVDIPLNEYEIADYAYYDAIGLYASGERASINNFKIK